MAEAKGEVKRHSWADVLAFLAAIAVTFALAGEISD